MKDKDFWIALVFALLVVGLLVGSAIRESPTNPHFASYGCVENTNCHK